MTNNVNFNNKLYNNFDFNIINNELNNIDIKFVNEVKNNIENINSSFNNLIDFTDELYKINLLSNKIEELFLIYDEFVKLSSFNDINEFNNYPKFDFNYIFDREIERGNIEYKRSLESYNENNKSIKLIRQIYWRIYEGIVSINKELCYYIIGIEDSGLPSFLTNLEIFNSINFVSKTIENTDLNYSFLIFKNTKFNYNYVIFKFNPSISDSIDFF